MATILCIETATKTCSVAVAVDGKVAALREEDPETYTHAERVNTFVQEAMGSAGFQLDQLDAIAVSEGPGSYTGLRIGVSSAKGLAYALNIPILAVSTLDALATRAADGLKTTLVIPMLDARRMEVFACGVDGSGGRVFATRAEILDEGSFPESGAFRRVVALGDGADKAAAWAEERGIELLAGQRASAADMAGLAQGKFHARDFVDSAYFEPFYLKDFVAGKKKRV